MFCENCGSQLNDGAVFCPNCGAKVGEEPAQTAGVAPVSAEPKKRTRGKKAEKGGKGGGKKVAIIAAAAVICVAAVVIGLLLRRGTLERDGFYRGLTWDISAEELLRKVKVDDPRMDEYDDGEGWITHGESSTIDYMGIKGKKAEITENYIFYDTDNGGRLREIYIYFWEENEQEQEERWDAIVEKHEELWGEPVVDLDNSNLKVWETKYSRITIIRYDTTFNISVEYRSLKENNQ